MKTLSPPAEEERVERIRKNKSHFRKRVKYSKTRLTKINKKHKKRLAKYDEYINSSAWRRRSSHFYGKYGKQCAACGTKKNITLHHMTYVNLFNEPDCDLAPLCRECHTEYHSHHKHTTVKATLAFIEEKRQMLITLPAAALS